MAWSVQDLVDEHVPGVLALNAANVPEVGPLSDERLAELRRLATWWVALDGGGEVVAQLVGLGSGAGYASPNYRWFDQRYDRIAYVDRVAVAPRWRGTGLADDLYDRWRRHAVATGATTLCAEVNVAPPNPRSSAFHRRRGFRAVAETTPYGDDQRVEMLVADVGPGAQS